MTAAAATLDALPYAGQPLSPELAAAVQEVSEVSSLPEITTKIVEVVEDPSATVRDMHQIVRTDPALAAKILKVVNSAFYGLPAQIASLDRAILMLGLSAVKNIALAASLSQLFKVDARSEQFAARDLWHHSVAVGVCARRLTEVAKLPHADEAFVAGLVHDMGLIVAQQLFREKLRVVIETCHGQPQDFRAVEFANVGATHEQFGAVLAAKWRFPPALRSTLAAHHDPAALPDAGRKPVTVVYIADTLCCQQKRGLWLTAWTQEVTADVLASVGLTQEQVDQVAAELSERVQEAEAVLSG